MKSLIKLLTAAILLSAATAPWPLSAAEPSRPNVVVILADDIGYECFGCYGSKQYHTPNIDRLAREGIRFNHCYSQPLCTPTRVELMTGLSNVRNYSAFGVLNRDQKTFAHYLRNAGYRTAVAGKWQLFGATQLEPRFRGQGMMPGQAGFDQYCLWHVERAGERHFAPLLNVDGKTTKFSKEHYGPDVVLDYAQRFMEENRDRPFFLYYPMILVHEPFGPTPDSADQNSTDNKRNFEDMVAYMDQEVGRLVQKTVDMGIAERTLILFAGDNGTFHTITSELNGRQIEGGKRLTTDAGTHVPLVGYWPKTIPAGQVSDDLVSFTDFLPTLLEAAGEKPPEGLDGRSFLPQLKGQRGNPREWLFSYSCPRPERNEPVRYARDQRFKLYGDGRLYDVANDPLEKRPLSSVAPGSDTAATKDKLARALESMPSEGQMLLKFAP